MRVACYERVSTAEQAEHGLSIDAQIAVLDDWAKQYTLVDHYTDRGVSARSPASKRPELQRMLHDCEAGKIDLIVFTKLDRFFRNIKEYYKVEDVLEKTGVAWKALHEDYETQTAAGRLKVNIMLAVAQDEADRTSERIKAVFERKRQMGLAPTASVPMGVKIEYGKYAPSEDTPKVQEIFRDFVATRSTSAVSTKYGYTQNGLRRLLKNELYLQLGIIDQTTFETVAGILQTRSQRHVRTDRVYLFSGLMFCPLCGCRMGALTTHGYVYYRCPRHSDGLCPQPNIREQDIEQFILEQIIPYVKDENLKLRKKQKKPVNVSALKQKRDKLTDLYMNDLIDKEKYTNDYKAIEKQIEEAEREPKPVDVRVVKTALEAYQMLSRSGKKAFWSALLKKIVPTENGFDFEVIYT